MLTITLSDLLTQFGQLLKTICILVQLPVDGRRSDRNVSVNINRR
jgi:hypothetical protein